MLTLYWTPFAISSLVEAVLAFLLALYFAWELRVSFANRHNVRASVIWVITFAAAAIGSINQTLAYSVHPDFRDYLHPMVSIFGVISMAGFVLFAYYFQRQEIKSNWFGRLLAIGLGAMVAAETYVAVCRILLLKNGLVEFRDAWLGFPFTVGFFAAHGFFAWALVKALARDRRLAMKQAMPEAIAAVFLPRTALPKQAAAARAFFYAAFIPSLFGLNLLAQSYGIIDWPLAVLLNNWVFLATLAAFATIYLNYIPEWMSLSVKVVGITMTVVLSICSGFAWLVGSQYAESYQNRYLPSAQTAIRFEPQAQGGYLVDHADYVFDTEFGTKIKSPLAPQPLLFDFPFYQTRYQQIFLHKAGMVGFDGRPLWRNIQHEFGPQPAMYLLAANLDEAPVDGSEQEPLTASSGLYVKHQADRLTVTWNRLVARHGSGGEYTFQLRLFPSGVIEMVYENGPLNPVSEIFVANAAPMMTGIVPGFENRAMTPVRFAFDLPLTAGPMVGLMEYHRMDFLNFLDRIYQPIAMFILGISLFILVLFPRFFQLSFNRPLRGLVSGVGDILDGNLRTKISINSRDELGFLANSFNEMAKVQHDLIEDLEDRVAARTATIREYAAKTAKLEERAFWARELHDAVSQTLFSSSLIADALAKQWQDKPGQTQDALDIIRGLNRDALKELRDLILEARPESVVQQSFGNVINDIVDNVRGLHGLNVSVSIGADTVLPQDVQFTLRRIAQECLINVAKHAKASQVVIFFEGAIGKAHMTIKDNGVGFDPEQVPAGHFGLTIMQERIEQLGGTFALDARPGHGVLISVRWHD